MTLYKFLFVITFFSATQSAFGDFNSNDSEYLSSVAAELVKSNFREIKKISRFIIKNYPTSEYQYVTVGRSPVPVEVYMRLTGVEVVNLPLTGARSLMLKEAEALFQTHFKRQIPSVDKKILFIDFSFFGGTFKALEGQLKKLSDRGDLNRPYEFLVLASKSRISTGLLETLEQELSTRYYIYSLSSFFGNLADNLQDHKFGVFAEYEPYYIIPSQGARPVRNRHHLIFINAMRKKLRLSPPVCKALL